MSLRICPTASAGNTLAEAHTRFLDQTHLTHLIQRVRWVAGGDMARQALILAAQRFYSVCFYQFFVLP